MQTINALHTRALRTIGAAADRCLIADSPRLRAMAEEAHSIAQRAYNRQDCAMMLAAIRTARAISLRAWKVIAKGGNV